MKPYRGKIILILLVLGAALWSMYPPGEKLRKGIDLEGGTILVYELQRNEDGSFPDVNMDDMIVSIKRRLDPAGVYNYEIRPVGANRIELIIPLQRRSKVDSAAKELRKGLLEHIPFEVAADLAHEDDHRDIITRAEKSPNPEEQLEGGMWVKVPAASIVAFEKLEPLPAGQAAKVSRFPDEQGGVICLQHRSAKGGVNVYVLGVDERLTGDVRVREAKARLSQMGNLKFRIVANERDQSALVSVAKTRTSPKRPVQVDDLKAHWARVDQDQRTFAMAPLEPGTNVRVEIVGGQVCAMRYRESPEAPSRRYVLVVDDKYDVGGEYLEYAQPTTANTGLGSAVAFTFDRRGGSLFYNLTYENKPEKDGFKRHLAILLDDEVMSAPVLNDAIGARGIIEGGEEGFKPDELKNLIAILNAGKLPKALRSDPIQEFHQGPGLGSDTIRRGQSAIMIGALSVVAFMLVYYLFAGVVADIALVMNLVLVLGAMALIRATFTLPGMAGLVLTVGMAVDANVLIFERIREELRRGSSLALAVKNGYEKAFRTIIDANVTTLITAMILYYVGTDIIKGFALVLMLGILASMFTALYVTRVIVDIVVAKRWIKRFHMLQFFREPKFNFMKYRRIAFVVSGLVIAIGIIGLASRGRDIQDIDFTGGSLVSIHTTVKMDSADVRQTVVDANLPDVNVVDVRIAGEEPGHRFLIRTTEDVLQKVKTAVRTAFEGKLVQKTMTIGTAEVIKGAASQPTATQPTPTAPTGTRPDTTSAVPAAAWAVFGAAGPDTPASSPASPPAPTPDEPTIDEPTGDGPEAAPETEVPFLGGTRVPLSFNKQVYLSDIRAQIAKHLVEQMTAETPGNTMALAEAQKLFSLKGTANTADLPARGKFTEMALEVDPSVGSTDFLEAVKARLAEAFDREQNIGGQIAGETQIKALAAILYSLLAIVAYIWIRFGKVAFGLAAILAVVHDVLIVVGLLALSHWIQGTIIGQALLLQDFKINLPIIGALLTIIGYSLNDTIVVFDRIREVRGKANEVTEEIIDASINQCLSRTVLTSMTTLLVVGVLYVVGGAGVHGFAFCLVVGVIVGTYSSIFIASPVLVGLRARATTAAVGGGRGGSKNKNNNR